MKFVESPIMNQLSYDVFNKKSLAAGFTYKDDLERGIAETILRLKNINFSLDKSNL